MNEPASTLAQVVTQAERGEDVLLARDGVPVARVVAIQETRVAQPRPPRTLGQWSGRVWMSDDFDGPLPEDELAAWYGGRP